jgi:ubiquinone/menaquinone biosynthesis C-methylase UbiE
MPRRCFIKADHEAETARVRAIQDKQAPGYDRQMGFFDRALFAGTREWACSQIDGRVLEVAVGTGRNMHLYPAGAQITGVELSPEMLALARERGRGLGVEVDLRLGDAQALEFANESFDTVLVTFAFCTIPNDRRAAEEAFRVLRPGGRLVAVEHVRSPVAAVRTIQRVIDPLSVRFGADHLTRDPLDYLPEIGFEIETVERSKWGIVERLRARRPAR